MADIAGTAANDVISGTIDADRIEGGAGNDRINAGAGDDVILGGAGSDILTGDAGNDQIFGEDGNDGVYGGGGDDFIDGGLGDDILIGDGGNDTILGGEGNDRLYGSTGNDVLIGGGGVDTLYGEAGNDTFVLEAGSGPDTVYGGTGLDRIELSLSSGGLTDAFRADVSAYVGWAAAELAAAGSVGVQTAQSAGNAFSFASIGLTLSGVEDVVIFVDGVETPLAAFLNQAPLAATVQNLVTDEDEVLSGSIGAHDADGDSLAYELVQAPQSGTLVLDPGTGAFVFTPAANVSGQAMFEVRISDPSGAAVTQTVTVDMIAVADAPDLAVSDAISSDVSTTMGTAGADTLTSGAVPGFASVALDIAAALSDSDGSEHLTVSIAGVPQDATLSAGARAEDGIWRLQTADLAGLMLTTRIGTDLALTVTATATEANGDAAGAAAVLNVLFETVVSGEVLDGLDGNDVLRGGDGDDVLVGGTGNDKAYGNAGDDLFVVGAGNDFYDGGAGFDTLDFSQIDQSITVDLSRSKASGAGTDTVRNFEAVVGTDAADKMTGSKYDNVLSSGDGNDDVKGGAGADRIDGGLGDDKLDGGSGNDVIFDGEGNDSAKGGSGDDLFMAGAGDDTYVGGSGFDTIDYTLASGAISVDVSKKSITGWGQDRIDGIEKVVGTAFADTFKGSSKADVLDGGAGDDILRGMGGKDILTGGAGDDLFQWLAKDVLSGSKHLGVDRITDYGAGDRLDVRDLTKSFKNAAIDDVVRLTEAADGTMLSVKAGNTFVDVVFLEDAHGLSAAALHAEGFLIA